jgi:hypothetical protein
MQRANDGRDSVMRRARESIALGIDQPKRRLNFGAANDVGTIP